jgi:IclR family KDG regulon transcriptional repressor
MMKTASKRKTTGDHSGNQSLSRALQILDLLSEADAGTGVREIARRLDLAPSIVQRLISTLAGEGYLEQSTQTRRYRIGHRLYQLGQVYVTSNNLIGSVLPELQMLAERHRLTASMGLLVGSQVMYAATAQAKSPIAVRVEPGDLEEVHCTSFGKALLFDMNDDEVLRLLGPGPYRRLTPKTLTNPRDLLRDLRRARQRGYAICNGENMGGIFAVSAPIYDATKRIVASLSGAIPANQLQQVSESVLANLVVSAAQRISRLIGASPGRLG